MMREKRRYKRFKLKDQEVNGKMILATEVKVVDVSISGIALKANRRLNIGSDYTLKLEGSKSISLRGTVVWCSLIETRKAPKGEMIPIYSAGMQFKDMSNDRVAELQYLIDSHKIEEIHVVGGTRRNIRFHIKDPGNSILIYPDNYKVKSINLGGMLIECHRNFAIESRIPMELLIHHDSPLKFTGRVASSQVIHKEDQKQYEIGIEFLGLREKDREVLSIFIEHCAMTETETKKEPVTTTGKSVAKDTPLVSSGFMDMGIESLDLTEKDQQDLASCIDPIYD